MRSMIVGTQVPSFEALARIQRGHMKILVTGATGLIGSALVASLRSGGLDVTRLLHSAKGQQENDLVWDATGGALDPSAFEGFDAVVHLAGRNIAARWTERTKAQIRDSRVKG